MQISNIVAAVEIQIRGPPHVYLFQRPSPPKSNMACIFSGIFYIENIRNRFLDCIFKDEDEELQKVTVILYTNRNATPYPKTSCNIQIGEVYLLQGLWVITDGDYLSPTVSSLIFRAAKCIAVCPYSSCAETFAPA